MKKQIIYILSVVLLLFLVAIIFIKFCQNSTVDTDIKNVKYLQSFINKNSVNDTLLVDDFNELYHTLMLYNLNDSNLIFVSLYKNYFLLYIKPDSISIYISDYQSENESLSICMTDLLFNNKLDSAVRLTEHETKIIYKYYIKNSIYKYVGIMDNKRLFIVFSDIGRLWSFPFKYERTIKNSYIKLGKLHFVNRNPFNIDSLKTVSIPKTLP